MNRLKSLLIQKGKSGLLLSGIVIITGLSSCSNDPEVKPEPIPDRIVIENDEELLGNRVTDLEDTIPLIETEEGARKSRTWFFWMILRNEIDPPVLEGNNLQASSAIIDGNLAVVSYNYQGSPFRGAIESYTVNKNAKMKSQILFKDADIHDVHFYDDKVYLATGSDNMINGTQAIAEVYPVKGFKFDHKNSKRIALGSFAANSVQAMNNYLLYSTGDNENNGGGVYLLDRSTFSTLNYIPLHDARWTAVGTNELFVLQGTPGQYSRFNNELVLQEQVPFAGADIPESKSTMEIHGNMAFIAAGTAGVQIYNILSNKKIGEIPVPESRENQITLTNSVSYDDGLLFISNGEGGIWVAEILTPVTSNVSEADLTLLGYMEFDNLPSVNHVAFKNNLLFIAAGKGGVKVVQIIRLGW